MHGGMIDLFLAKVDTKRCGRKPIDYWSDIIQNKSVEHIAAFEVKYANHNIEGDFEKLRCVAENHAVLPVFVFIESDGFPKKRSKTLTKTIPEYMADDIVVLYGLPYHAGDWKLICPQKYPNR